MSDLANDRGHDRGGGPSGIADHRPEGPSGAGVGALGRRRDATQARGHAGTESSEGDPRLRHAADDADQRTEDEQHRPERGGQHAEDEDRVLNAVWQVGELVDEIRHHVIELRLDRDELVADNRRVVLRRRGRDPELIGQFVGRVDEVVLDAIGLRHDRVERERRLLLLIHLVPRLVDALRHGEGFERRHPRVDAEAPQRARLATQARLDRGHGIGDLDIEDRRHVGRPLGEVDRRIGRLIGRETDVQQTGTDRRDELIESPRAEADRGLRSLAELLDLAGRLAEGDLDGVDRLGQGRRRVDRLVADERQRNGGERGELEPTRLRRLADCGQLAAEPFGRRHGRSEAGSDTRRVGQDSDDEGRERGHQAASSRVMTLPPSCRVIEIITSLIASGVRARGRSHCGMKSFGL